MKDESIFPTSVIFPFSYQPVSHAAVQTPRGYDSGKRDLSCNECVNEDVSVKRADIQGISHGTAALFTDTSSHVCNLSMLCRHNDISTRIIKDFLKELIFSLNSAMKIDAKMLLNLGFHFPIRFKTN